MGHGAAHDLAVAVAGLDHGDETGAWGKAVQVFNDNVIGAGDPAQPSVTLKAFMTRFRVTVKAA